jgi:serine/threonine protein kinase/Flp pilus assembly protein TadD
MNRIKEIFAEALDLQGADLTAYLDKACADNPELRAKVEALLAAAAQTDAFRETAASNLSERPGTVIGRYKLLEQIGEGGFGVVFMAEQQAPIQRRVALKIIKLGMDTKLVVARFEAERQALAMMDHPNIAKVFDGGATEAGRPYFVMELVRGISITDYCDQHNLPVRRRLELFAQVCQAVQHAHQKGIIHRDLKPTNVLVADYDDRPVPKVIDFGVAKAIGEHLTEKTMFTQFGQIVGTVEYMSPEQAKLNQLDIDTRSDIYSLGVLLYQLLTGETPFDRQRLRSAAFDEMLRIIREEEPPKPSTRLSSLFQRGSGGARAPSNLASIAADRQTDPRKLSRDVQGELDWIVMKALEKDRNRRYETAIGLARDIQRYLADEAVEACPPTAGYKLRKFARKNRKALTIVGAFIILLAAGTVVSTWQAIRARNEANAKAVALVAEQKARDQAFAVLRSMAADVIATKFPSGTVLTEDDRAFLQGVVVQAVILAKARNYISLSQWDKAAAEYAKVDWSRPLEDDTFAYACLFLIRGDTEGYIRFCQGLVRRAGQMEGPEAYVMARTCAIAPQSPVDPARAVEWANQNVAGSQNPWDFHVLGLAQYRAGQFDKALQSFTKANDKAWAYADINWFGLALVHQRLGQPDQARQCLDKGIHWLTRVGPSGPDQPARLDPHDWLEAQLLYREAVDQLPNSFELHVENGSLLQSQQKFAQALAEFTEAIRLNPEMPDAWAARGECYRDINHFAKMAQDYSEAIKLAPDQQWYWHERGYAYMQLGDDQQALADHTKTIDLGDTDPEERMRRGRAYERLGEFVEAVADYSRAIQLDPKNEGAWFRRGRAHQELKQYENACADYSKAIELKPDVALFWTARADSWTTIGRTDKAAQDLAKAIALRSKELQSGPNDAWANNNLAWLLATVPDENLRDPKRAVELATKAVQLAPTEGTIVNTLGVARYCAGDFQQAVNDLEKSMSLRNGVESDDFFFMAMAEWQLGRRTEAKTWYDKAVAWMDKNQPTDPELAHFRAEAAELLRIPPPNPASVPAARH